MRAAAKKDGAGETGDALYAYFLERVRTNLHVILCLSPIGEAFRERCRMFPGSNPSTLRSCMYHAAQSSEAVLSCCPSRDCHKITAHSMQRNQCSVYSYGIAIQFADDCINLDSASSKTCMDM